MFRRLGTKDHLVDRVADEIQSLILERHLQPGTRLPPERDLCEMLGVSRTVLREGVGRLVSKGLLETRHGSGTIVRQITSSQISAPLSLLVETSAGSITLDHLHHVRSIIEVEIARLAALQATESDITNLTDILNQMEQARADRALLSQKDAEFHSALADTTHNPLLGILLDTIRDLMRNVRFMVQSYPGLADIILPDHWRILSAIRARKPAQAERTMQEHLEHARLIQLASLSYGKEKEKV